MQISVTVLNVAMDTEFNNGSKTYNVRLVWSAGGGTSDPITIDFTSAVNGSVQLTSAKSFTVSSGVTVTGIQVRDNLGEMLLSDTITSETFVAAGTFTINNIIITLTA